MVVNGLIDGGFDGLIGNGFDGFDFFFFHMGLIHMVLVSLFWVDGFAGFQEHE